MSDILNDRQREAVELTEGPLLILAGAGSGKTRVLTHRIAYLIDKCGVDPWNIMAITFTNKAAGEMRERVDKMVGAGAESIWISTFHSSCVRMLRRFADRLGYDNSFTIYDTDDTKSVMKGIMKRLQISNEDIKERTILSRISDLKNNGIGPDEFTLSSSGDFREARIASAYRAYQNELLKNNAMDFDDLLVNAVELLKTNEDVRESYQDRLKYIMVDEYQDTNTIQFEFIRILAGTKHNICVVGDDDQSIYKFRGANIRNILDFELHFPEAKVIRLEQNYRSTQVILDAANSVIRNNSERKEKSLWTDRASGNALHFMQFQTAYEEAEFIASDIKRRNREGKLHYDETAVLYRTNAQARLIEEQMVSSSIPYNVVGGVNFYARKEIKDVLAYLKTVDNGVDDLAVKRIINVPRRGIGGTTISRIEEYAAERNISFFNALEDIDYIEGAGRAKSKIENFVTMIRVFRAKAETLSVTELIKDILKSTDYIEKIEADSDEQAMEKTENVEELISKAAIYEEADPEGGLSGFLAEVALVSDIDDIEGGERVLLTTLHGAKGLEFSNVYIAGMEDGIFPGYVSTLEGNEEDLEEERRLAYVGITRAKDNLTFTAARSRMVRGEMQYNKTSRFLNEIPRELFVEKVPSAKVYDLVEYDDDSYARSSFKKKAYEPVVSLNAGEDTSYAGRDTSYSGKKKEYESVVLGKSKKAAGYDKGQRYGDYKPTGVKALVKGGITKGIAGAGEKPDYEVGDKVRHIKFGRGTVKEIKKGTKDYEVTVTFDDEKYGNKIMMAGFAKLVKCE